MNLRRFASHGILTSLALGLSSLAQAAPYIEAHCRSANVADAGYEIIVQREAETGALTLHLGEVNLAGTSQIAFLRTVQVETSNPPTRSFVGKDLRLDIDLSGPAFRCGPMNPATPGTPTESPAVRCLKSPYRAIVSGNLIGNPQWSRLFCTVPSDILTPPPVRFPGRGGITCMAYWDGAVFDPAIRSCRNASVSGCKNPFEFHTVEECEQAFATRQ